MKTMPHLRSTMWKAMAICGALGALVGLGATAAWTSRRFADARDRHWLQTHPIDYA
jgi:hypothetical protein